MGHLDCDGAIQLFVLSQVDQPKSAFAQDGLDAVAANPCRVFDQRGVLHAGGRLLLGSRHIIGVEVAQVRGGIPLERQRLRTTVGTVNCSWHPY